jgi:hypothetical protein
MLALRRRDGLPTGELQPTARSGVLQLVTWGLVEPGAAAHGRVVLTRRGRLMADAVVRELLP